MMATWKKASCFGFKILFYKRLDTRGKFRNSHRRCSVKKGVLKNFANFTGKHLCWSPFLILLQVFRPATLLKRKILQHWCFPVKFLRTPILKNICQRQLLFISPKNTITNSGDEFEPDETSTEWEVSIFLNVTILFNQMQPYNLYVS